MIIIFDDDFTIADLISRSLNVKMKKYIVNSQIWDTL